jgi:putative protease
MHDFSGAPFSDRPPDGSGDSREGQPASTGKTRWRKEVLCHGGLAGRLGGLMNSAGSGSAAPASPPNGGESICLPELLAPAGDWECAMAAVENGADAIYFGLERFNARMRAHNFTEADLPKLMEFLHRRGVKGYVTFNTLVFQNEMAEAEQYLRAIIAAGVDAAIVQDAGICRLIRRLSPDFPIHASTQMTVTSAAGVEFARDLGCNLVVLARECSIKEIESIRRGSAGESKSVSSESVISNQSAVATAPGHQPRPNAGSLNTDSLITDYSPLPLEVFVHGALCVAYSGQCLTSEALGGRSANRGECAQACRMPYELISDGRLVPLGDRQYLLSPQDLAGLEVLPELVRAGVASLKIEGRLKTPEYVANITRIYRGALDQIASDSNRGDAETQRSDHELNSASPRLSGEKAHYDLEMAFSRGLYSGWLRGINNQELVHARFGKKRGVYLGEITRVQNERVFLRLEAPLKPGDGVVFDSGHPEQKEEGGRVYEVQSGKLKTQNGPETMLAFGWGDIDFSRVHVGDKLWKTSDPELDRRLRQSFEGDAPKFQRPIQMEVHGRAGQPMTLIVRDEEGHVVQVTSSIPLAVAEKQPLDQERLAGQLGRLGGTPFRLGELKNRLEGAVILPVSELNRLRREAVAELEKRRTQPKRWVLSDRSSRREEALDGSRITHYASHIDQSLLTSAAPNAELIVLVRNLPQLEAALSCGVATLYCEFEDPKKYREAVALARNRQSAINNRQSELWVAPPRIFKTGEEWTLKQVRSCDADGYLIRNYDHLKFFADSRRIGDFSLNVANALTADYFRNRFGLERLTASYDLNGAQLEALLQAAPPEWFEVTIHQHMPMFHMEHCVFCAFLSKGTDYTNCGRPCDRHDVRLRDRVGAEHILKADAGCRNTLFNATAQTGAEHVARLLALGVRDFRIEFVSETPGQVTQTIAKYRALLRGEISDAQLWRELKLHSQLGVTRGTMEKR